MYVSFLFLCTKRIVIRKKLNILCVKDKSSLFPISKKVCSINMNSEHKCQYSFIGKREHFYISLPH